MKELKLEELTVRQKLGMVMVASVGREEGLEYALELVRQHSIGAIWLNTHLDPDPERTKAKILEAADYPVLLISDAESGIGNYLIGRHNALGCTGSEELAYTFGKITAIEARRLGCNVICNPLLDMANGNSTCGGNVRSIGNNKETVARLAAAEARGLHDGGVLTVGKHYPGASDSGIDSHMAETSSKATVEELLDYALYPYQYLIDRGLLDGIMTKHTRYANIDPDYPASLSQKVINIIREHLGFEGFALTDALSMMGVVAKFGLNESKGLAIANGNDLALTWCDPREGYEALCECYDKGMIDDARLDEAVQRVLDAQHKTLIPPKYSEITEEDLEKFNRINSDSIYARADEGLSVAIPREGRHFFAVLTQSNVETDGKGRVTVDPLSKGWYRPMEIIKMLEEKFPNSTCFALSEFPPAYQNMNLLSQSLGYDDVVFITFFESAAYIGREQFTPRTISLIEAMQVTNRISTIVHFGNPYVLEDLPHVSRLILSPASADSAKAALNVLSGEYPAKGVMTYNVNLK